MDFAKWTNICDKPEFGVIIAKKKYFTFARRAVLKNKGGRTAKTKSQNLLTRLGDFEEAGLAFLHDINVPFANNLAEQDIRMIKVRLKISGCFRTVQGAEQFTRIRSYLSTARKQGRDILASITAAIKGAPSCLFLSNLRIDLNSYKNIINKSKQIVRIIVTVKNAP